MEFSITTSCRLDADEIRSQRDRYRGAGEGATVLERTSRRLVVEISPAGASVFPDLVEVESDCCPFFELDWDSSKRRFSIAVAEREHEPALEAIGFALGL